MSKEIFINYWIGQEPTGPGKSPPLNQMPDYVDIVPLAFVSINDKYQLDYSFLTQQNSAEVIKGWISEIRSKGIKVLLSINSDKFVSVPDPVAFAAYVKIQVDDWGVDGIDIDFEPPSQDNRLITVTKALRAALGPTAIMTSPIYGPWYGYSKSFVSEFASCLDYVTTMDYTPYIGYQSTIDSFKKYTSLMGSTEKLVIGVSCMLRPDDFTPIDDVVKFCKWEPQGSTKGGMMLYTFSYDIKTRPKGGTGLPDGTFTKTIHDNLPK